MTPADIVSSLRAARLFRVLSNADLKPLATPSNVLRYDPDSTIFYRGDPPHQVYLILEGRVAVESMSNQGKAIALSALGKGEVFGEMAVLDGRERSANIRTLEPTSLLAIGNNQFHALLRDHSAFAQEVIQDLVLRLRRSDAKIESIMFFPLRRRLADLLLSMFRAQGDTIHVTQAELAHLLTATREKVNVNLQVLQKAGSVALSRGRITLLDEEILSRVR